LGGRPAGPEDEEERELADTMGLLRQVGAVRAMAEA
jgi:hypothetical protein